MICDLHDAAPCANAIANLLEERMLQCASASRKHATILLVWSAPGIPKRPSTGLLPSLSSRLKPQVRLSFHLLPSFLFSVFSTDAQRFLFSEGFK